MYTHMRARTCRKREMFLSTAFLSRLSILSFSTFCVLLLSPAARVPAVAVLVKVSPPASFSALLPALPKPVPVLALKGMGTLPAPSMVIFTPIRVRTAPTKSGNMLDVSVQSSIHSSGREGKGG